MNDLNVFPVTAFGPEDRGFVYAIARRIVGNAEDADDVAQEALLLAFRYRHAFRGASHYRSWLYRIAATAAYGHLRKRGRSREQLAFATDPALAPELPDPAPSAEAALIEHEALALLRAAIDALDPKYRDVLIARTELGEAACAERLGLSLPNVKVRAHRARKQLSAALAL